MTAVENIRSNVAELTVSELSMALKRTVEETFGYVRVRGELGNVKYHSSGHIYLDLKDEKACLAGVVWRMTAPRIKLKLEAGLEVVVTGRITTYPGQSKYQIVIETLEPAGLGALMALVEERKKKLAAEGLFNEARKQLLPFLPTVIGVVTSPTGAVIRDILHRLNDRFPRHVLVWPVKVQGEGSAEQVAAAIHGFNALPQAGAMPRPDLIIVARGGGSLEDLWSFNEEIVVRAAAESMIPLISAVGHETDVTLIDFAADRRAPTPTAAAEMAVPVRAELIAEILGLAQRTVSAWTRGLDARRIELRAAARALPSAEGLLAIPRQRLDTSSERLPLALRANAQVHHTAYSRLAGRLNHHTLRALVERRRERYSAISARLAAGLRANAEAQRTRVHRAHERVGVLGARADRAMHMLLAQRAARAQRVGELLGVLSYHGVLARGFALVRALDGRPIQSATEVASGLNMDVQFADGRVRAVAQTATGTVPVVQPSRPRGKRGAGDPGQGSLF